MPSSTSTEFICYGSIDSRTREVKSSILNDLAILDVQTVDGFERSVFGRKLRDDGELAICVHFQTGAIVVVVTEAVGVVAAPPLIACSIKGTFGASAFVETSLVAGVRRNRSCHFVGFPNIHFVAAGTFALDITLMAS